ncbi:MAG TPA: DUF5343 domain-containing protein [Candidatus Acidoferrum sp.]|nr:DUF5343 domain-containing protein [Candidatus Acidoferrum sp.]
MALSSSYIQVYGQLPDVFSRMSEAQAPEKFTRQYLKDLGFSSSNFHALIPLLKSLNFLTADGTPTNRYLEYRNTARSRQVMAEALRGAYGDLFTIKAKPTEADRPLIEGKFKSAHNVSPNLAKLMASTFYALLSLADLEAPPTAEAPAAEEPPPMKPSETETPPPPPVAGGGHSERHSEVVQPKPTLHYNIQIHLPATKDVEVFNAIFKALKEHLLD